MALLTGPRRALLYSAKDDLKLLHYDSFQDTPLTLLTNHTPEIGNSYSNISGSFRITAGGIVCEAVSNGSFVWTDPGEVARSIYCRWRNFLDAQLLRTCFRVSGVNNRFYVEPFTFGDDIWLKKVVGGTTTPLQQANPTIANLTWYQMWIDISHNNVIRVYHTTDVPAAKPASPIITYADSDLATNTGVGFNGLNATQRWDELTVWGSV